MRDCKTTISLGALRTTIGKNLVILRRFFTTEATEGTEDTADLIRKGHLSRTLL